MRIVISQPRYLPFVPYLQRLKNADLFVFLDDVQRQSRGYENRNKILTQRGVTWVTLPIASSSRALICNSQIDGLGWLCSHRHHIENAYSSHKFYSKEAVDYFFRDLPIMQGDNSFSVNVIAMLLNICHFFGFDPSWVESSSLNVSHSRGGPLHLADIAREVYATEYISGANGKEYGVGVAFEGVCPVVYHNPSSTIYSQPFSDDHVPFLAFIDELFSTGKDALRKRIFQKLQLVRQ